MLLGCIADDFTGATDIALTLTREGMRTLQCAGLPSPGLNVSDFDAVVVALKSRTGPADEAVRLSLLAAAALRRLGAQRLVFKYCSTFDSTDAGNIGPVADALLVFVDADGTIACPAFPRAGRTVYGGRLFVHGVPLDESPMRDHPLTPMRDDSVVRLLQRQTRRSVGLVGYEVVDAGADAVRAAFSGLAPGYAIVDAIKDEHLRTIGQALSHLPLLTGSSGVALGLPAAYLRAGLLGELTPAASRMAAPVGRRAILAGSCSTATRGQVAVAIAAGMPALRVDPLDLAAGRQDADLVLRWVDGQHDDRPVVIYSSDDPEAVRHVQDRLGRAVAGDSVERLMGSIAAALPERGFTRLIVAGGETSGAVVEALGVSTLAIGPEIDTGVPWTRTRSREGPELALALKSGNFGSADFFLKGWDLLS